MCAVIRLLHPQNGVMSNARCERHIAADRITQLESEKAHVTFACGGDHVQKTEQSMHGQDAPTQLHAVRVCARLQLYFNE